MASELVVAEGFLQGKLSADTALNTPGNAAYVTGIFSGRAPRDQLPPYIVYDWQGGVDVVPGLGKIRIASEPLYLVRVVSQTRTYKSLQAAANQIDEVLHGSNGSWGGYRVAACVRAGEYSQIEPQEEEWRHLGGYYRLYIVSIPM